MNLLMLIRLVVSLLSKAIPIPDDWTDAAAVEAWLRDMNNPLAQLIAEVAMQLSLNTGEQVGVHDLPLSSVVTLVQECCEEADRTEIDPATIIAIITAVVKLIELWRNRRNPDPQPAPGPDLV